MPPPPTFRRSTTYTDQNVLPTPATKLIITQHLRLSQDPPCFGWIIVAAFYDRSNRPIWSTEILISRIGADSDWDSEDSSIESSEESSDGESNSVSGSSSSVEENTSTTSPSSLGASVASTQPSNSFAGPLAPLLVDYYHNSQPTPFLNHIPPTNWDPVVQGPVPGYWRARFDPSMGRWIHTWQYL